MRAHPPMRKATHCLAQMLAATGNNQQDIHPADTIQPIARYNRVPIRRQSTINKARSLNNRVAFPLLVCAIVGSDWARRIAVSDCWLSCAAHSTANSITNQTAFRYLHTYIPTIHIYSKPKRQSTIINFTGAEALSFSFFALQHISGDTVYI